MRCATHLHADAATAGAALEHDRITNVLRLGQRGIGIGQQAGARQQRHAGLLGQRARRVLEAEHPHLMRRRPHEGQTGGFTGLDKGRIF